MTERKGDPIKDPIIVNQGVPQGSKIAPPLFNGIIDAALKKACYILIKSISKLEYQKTKEMIEEINCILAFADDTLVMSDNLLQLRNTIQCLEIEFKILGLSFNFNKCEMVEYSGEFRNFRAYE